jgi:uncharacterized protein YwgA
MSEDLKSTIVLQAMQSLKDEGSWCGETHVQKTIYLCQELLGVPSHFKYVLYKHGPYSFQLSDYIQSLISDELVQVMARPPYGPSLDLSSDGKSLVAVSNSTKEYVDGILKLSKRVSNKNVAELEKLATAIFVKRHNLADETIDSRAQALSKLKPHISIEAAKSAVREADIIETEFAFAV